MILEKESKLCLSLRYQNKQVKVTLEFPEQPDRQAEQELNDRLKAIYLTKIEEGNNID